MSVKRKRGRPPDDPEHGAMTGAERKRRWKQQQKDRRREPDFRYHPISIGGSGGLTAHVGGSALSEAGDRAEERQRANRDASLRDRDSFDDSLDEAGAFNPDSRPDPGPIPGISDAHDHHRRWGWKKRGGGTKRAWIPERSDQFLSPAPVPEVARFREAARKIVERVPWLVQEDWVVQEVAIELAAGARRRDEFSPFLTDRDREGDSLLWRAVWRLASLGAIHIERVADENTFELKPKRREK